MQGILAIPGLESGEVVWMNNESGLSTHVAKSHAHTSLTTH